MSVGHFGQNLIFLISQPRAGSTLLQRILGNLPDVHTISEPWLLLPPVYSTRESGVWYEFDAQTAQIAHQSFVEALPHGEDDINEAMRQMYIYLYNRVLDGSNKSNFLDKTPRYYLIIPDLHRLFPEAHFIILFRNPLGVLSSIQRTWVRERWLLLHKRRKDLLVAPKLLIEGIKILGDSCTVVHYEKLVNDPVRVIERICMDLEVEFSPDSIDYGSFDHHTWRQGDKEGITKHSKPDPVNADKWVEDLQSAQVWRLANDYLNYLGESTVDQMGYSYSDTSKILHKWKPNIIRLWFTYPSWFMLRALNITEVANISERRIDRFIEILGDDGVGSAAHAAMQGLRTRNNKT